MALISGIIVASGFEQIINVLFSDIIEELLLEVEKVFTENCLRNLRKRNSETDLKISLKVFTSFCTAKSEKCHANFKSLSAALF